MANPLKVEYERNQTGRIFESDFFERSSKVHPATPFVFYIPLISALLVWALAVGVTTGPLAALGLASGWVIWSWMEYAIHRWFFHWEGSGPVTRKLHDIVHGYHHRYPDDPLRAVMPLGASIPLALVLAAILWLFHAPAITVPLFVGVVAGYLYYDFTHWALHHRAPRTAWGKAMRSHHLAHHFAVPDKNYGISHRWIDAVTGTLRRRDRADP